MASPDEVEVDHADIARTEAILHSLQVDEVELIDPPDDLWASIAAVVESERDIARAARTAPRLQHSTELVVEYRIDADDRVMGYGDGWGNFARENDAPELAELAGTETLWSFMSSETCRGMWQMIVERARSGGEALQVPLRCDAPHARRWFEMVVTPEADGQVHFLSTLVFEELREPVSLLDMAAERDDAGEAVPLCTWCGQVEHDGRWTDVETLLREARLLEQPVMPPVDYGVCSGCRDDMTAEFAVITAEGDA